MMKDSRAEAVASQTEQTRIRLQVGLGLFFGILLVQGVVSMAVPGKQAADVATPHDRIAMVELSAR
jgi:hypothetical protein